jgi:hypothetical protein
MNIFKTKISRSIYFLHFPTHFSLTRNLQTPSTQLLSQLSQVSHRPVRHIQLHSIPNEVHFNLNCVTLHYKFNPPIQCTRKQTACIIHKRGEKFCAYVGHFKDAQPVHFVKELHTLVILHPQTIVQTRCRSPAEIVTKTPSIPTFQSLISLLNTAYSDLIKGKYIASRDDPGLALLSSGMSIFHFNTDEWKLNTCNYVRSAYKGGGSAEPIHFFLKRQTRFAQKINRWTSKPFVAGVHSSCSEGVLSTLHHVVLKISLR